MADPLGIVGAVLSAIHAVERTIDFVSTIQDAPTVVKAAYNDLTSLLTCLNSLHDHVTSPNFSEHPSTGHLLSLIQQPLTNCSQRCDRLSDLIQPYVKFESTPSGSGKWRRFSFGFREKDVRSIQQDLLSCKATLEVAVGLANFIVGQAVTVSRTDRRADRIQLALGSDTFSDASTVVGDSEYRRPARSRQDVVNWLHSSNPLPENVEPEPSDAPTAREERAEAQTNLTDRPSWRRPITARCNPNSSGIHLHGAAREYLQPDFDLNALTVPRLKSFLSEHGMRFARRASKDTLLSLANDLQKRQKSLGDNARESYSNGVADGSGEKTGNFSPSALVKGFWGADSSTLATPSPVLRPSFSKTSEIWITGSSYTAGYAYADRKGALSFRKGEFVEIIEWHRDGRAKGRVGNKTGWVPQNGLLRKVK